MRVWIRVYLMRVRLPRRPGSLGAVATLLGRAGVNIARLQVRARDERGSVLDFLLDFPHDSVVELAVAELDRLEGVRVESVTRYPTGGSLHYDLEVIQRMTSGEPRPEQVLATAAPLLCQAQWALLVDLRNSRVRFRTPLAPDVTRDDLARLAPLDSTHASELPGCGDAEDPTPCATVPLPPHTALVIGRPAGPPFAPSELARLAYLAAAAGNCGAGSRALVLPRRRRRVRPATAGAASDDNATATG